MIYEFGSERIGLLVSAIEEVVEDLSTISVNRTSTSTLRIPYLRSSISITRSIY